MKFFLVLVVLLTFLYNCSSLIGMDKKNNRIIKKPETNTTKSCCHWGEKLISAFSGLGAVSGMYSSQVMPPLPTNQKRDSQNDKR